MIKFEGKNVVVYINPELVTSVAPHGDKHTYINFDGENYVEVKGNIDEVIKRINPYAS